MGVLANVDYNVENLLLEEVMLMMVRNLEGNKENFGFFTRGPCYPQFAVTECMSSTPGERFTILPVGFSKALMTDAKK